MPTHAEVMSWPQVPGPTGSNGGTWHRDPSSGRTYFVKPSTGAQGKDRAMNEAAVAAFYRAAGVPVPNVVAVDDGNGNHFVISEKVDVTPWSKSKQADAKKHMGFDMIISNWDGFGVSGQNVGIDAAGNVVRIDAGGGGLFRATGAAKPDFDPNKPWKETSTMINSPFGKDMYGDVTNKEFADAMRAVADLDLNEVEKEMRALGVDANTQKQIMDVLRARQTTAKQFVDDFDKYDPNAKVVISSGNPIAPGGNLINPPSVPTTPTRKPRKKTGAGPHKQTELTDTDRLRPQQGAKKRILSALTSLLEKNRNGSALGDNDKKPVVTPAFIKKLSVVNNPANGKISDTVDNLYDIHGFSEKPVQLTQEEYLDLIEQGWKPVMRGVGGGYNTSVTNPDPNNPKQTWGQKMVWGFLAGKRFNSGTGSNGMVYGVGDYFATPRGASGQWSSYHGTGQPVNGLQHNMTIAALMPPNARIVKRSKMQTLQNEFGSEIRVLNRVHRIGYGGAASVPVGTDVRALIQGEISKGNVQVFGRGSRGRVLKKMSPAMDIFAQMFEARNNAKTAQERLEIEAAIDNFQRMQAIDPNYMAMVLGYDAVDAGDQVMIVLNRSNLAVLGEATNIPALRTLVNSTQRSKTDPEVRM